MSLSLRESSHRFYYPLLFAIVCACGPTSGRTTESVRPPAASIAEESQQTTTYRLTNGLRVVLVQDCTLPLIGLAVGYRLGGLIEEPETYGLSHLVEHLSFQGTSHIPKDLHDSILSARGGGGSAFTGFDSLIHYSTAPPNQLPVLLWLESDRMGFLEPALTQERFENQREVVIREFKQNFEEHPYGMAEVLIEELAFPAPHPYHGAVLGRPSQIATLELSQASSFLSSHWRAANAVLVIVGAFDVSFAKDQIQHYFGSLPTGAETKPQRVSTSSGTGSLSIRDDVAAPRVTIGWVGPARSSAESAALTLYSSMLAGSQTAWLVRQLVEDKGLASSVACVFYPRELSSLFQCDAVAVDGVSTDVLEKELVSSINSAFPKDEFSVYLKRAKAIWELSFLERLQAPSDRARWIAEHALWSAALPSIEKHLAAHWDVTIHDVARVREKWLKPEQFVSVVIEPEERDP